MKYIYCPKCGMQLINLSEDDERKMGVHRFWCNICDLDITIEDNNAEREGVE